MHPVNRLHANIVRIKHAVLFIGHLQNTGEETCRVFLRGSVPVLGFPPYARFPHAVYASLGGKGLAYGYALTSLMGSERASMSWVLSRRRVRAVTVTVHNRSSTNPVRIYAWFVASRWQYCRYVLGNTVAS